MKASRGLCIFLVGASIPLFAQQALEPSTAPASSATYNPSQPVHQSSDSANPLITLDVVVTDKSGRPQAGLQQQDFTLLDNKKPQKVVSFRAVEEPSSKAVPPVEVILFMDTV